MVRSNGKLSITHGNIRIHSYQSKNNPVIKYDIPHFVVMKNDPRSTLNELSYSLPNVYIHHLYDAKSVQAGGREDEKQLWRSEKNTGHDIYEESFLRRVFVTERILFSAQLYETI